MSAPSRPLGHHPVPPSAEEILGALDPDQRRAAQHVDGPVRILAGAGAGKTRTITHRIAYAVATGQQRADRGIAVTFTARAAGEMRERLAGLGVVGLPAMTFHAAALKQLRHFWPDAVGGRAPEVLPKKIPVIAEAAASLGIAKDRWLLRDLAAEIEWAKVSRISPQDYPEAAQRARREVPGGLTGADLSAVMVSYQELLAQQGRMDFEDVLVLTVAMLTDRPDLADKVRARYRWFTVDEFQDVSALQHALLDIWLGDGDQVCVVGDPGQTIYTFAGASPRYLLDFDRRFPGAATVPLPRTYRCTPQIVTSANRLLAAAPQARSRPPLRLVSQLPDGPAPRIRPFEDDLAEAAAVAEQVREWRAEGVAARQIAVLVRTNAATSPIEDALAEAGIPYTVASGDRFFARSEVRETLTRLRGAANAPGSGSLPDQVAEVLVAMGFNADEPPAGRGAVRDRWESLAAVQALSREFASPGEDGEPPTMTGFVAELDRRAALEAAPSPDGVTVTTLHAAKGLEWDAVWIAGAQEGTLPISYADTPDRVEEERRLLYVGITRARRYLDVSWARSRLGDKRPRSGSRFLADLRTPGQPLADDVVAVPGAARGKKLVKRSGKLAKCRICGRGLATAAERSVLRCRTCPDTIDVALYEALREWRLAKAGQTGAPAYVVFTDATLRAMAELKPTSEEGLLAISGIGPGKLAKYGDEVLAIIGSASGHPARVDD